jgi:hypothetical protein
MRPLDEDENAITGTPPQTPPATLHGVEDLLPPREAPSEATGEGTLFPALIIGLGHLGLGVLRRLRAELTDRFGSETLSHLRLLYMDCDPVGIPVATQGRSESALRHSEVLLTRLHRPSHYLKPGDHNAHLADWFNPKMLYRIPRQQVPSGMRALGRLAFVDNYRYVARRLQNELEACLDEEALNVAARRTGLGLRSNRPRVYVVTGLGGGTGSGMFLDVAYVARNLLRRLGYEQPEVIGLFLLPPLERSSSQVTALGNAYAALTELNHFSSPSTVFTGPYGKDEARGIGSLVDAEAPFQRCVLLPLSAESTSDDRSLPPAQRAETLIADPCIALAGYYLCSDLTTPLGRTADLERPNQQTTNPGRHNKGQGTREHGRSPRDQGPGSSSVLLETSSFVLSCQTFGMSRILWPRRQLLQQAARRICRRLVQRWMTKDARPLREVVQRWIREQWTALALDAEPILSRFQRACEQALGNAPENVFRTILEPLASMFAPRRGSEAPAWRPGMDPTHFQPELVLDLVTELEHLLGSPDAKEKGVYSRDEDSELSPSAPRTLSALVQEAGQTLATECEQKLAELAVCLIEQPEFRMAGAEEALRQATFLVEQVLQHHEPLAKELQERAQTLFERVWGRLAAEKANSKKTRRPPDSQTRKQAAAAASAFEWLELLRAYAKYRYQSLVLDRFNALYVRLRGHLSDQIREVGYCRARLTELVKMLGGAENPPISKDDLQPPSSVGMPSFESFGRCLFPAGCGSLQEAAQQLEGGVTTPELQELDRRIQTLIQNQFTALVHVCTTPSNVICGVRTAMLQEAEAFLASRLDGSNVVELFLEQHAPGAEGNAPPTLTKNLVAAYQTATPSLSEGIAGPKELCILAVPPGTAEVPFRDLARHALPEVDLLAASNPEEIVFYREETRLPLTDLEQLGPPGREAYEQMTGVENFTPHSRTDITEWREVE